MKEIRKTKVVCTIGPASSSREVIKQLMLEGMNVARFNCSHGDNEEKLEKINIIKELREELKLPVAILLDTKGPEIRLGDIAGGSVVLEPEQKFTLTTRDLEGDANIVSVTYKDIIKDVEVGKKILIDDGLIEMIITDINETDIICKVINGGTISSRKGVNIPGATISMPFISKRDYEDIVFGIKNGLDYIAASFTRSAEDILDIRKILDEYQCNNIGIIAKIENMQGVNNIDEIIKASDGIMVARGDMGVEIPLEEVPVIQKVIIKKVFSQGKTVITATQMLESMIKNPRPTRAEITDVANAIYDGTSAIMLSGETAAGKYPVEALKTMVRIAKRTEQDIDYFDKFKKHRIANDNNITNAISHATCTTAEDIKTAAIITVTKSGFTAKMISKFRPNCPILGCCTYDYVYRQLSLVWGVTPILIEEKEVTEELFEHAVDEAIKKGLVEPGELTVITAGIPLGVSGTTNMIKVQVAGHVLVKGYGVSGEKVCGSLCVCNNEEEVLLNFKPGDILVVPRTSNRIINQMKSAAGIITEDKSEQSHAAIVGLSLDIPVIIGAEHATQILKSGAVVAMDATTGGVCANN